MELIQTDEVDDKASSSPSELTVAIDGMTCRSCEILIEQKWKKLPGVTAVNVNAAKGKARLMVAGCCPSVADLQAALGEAKYRISPEKEKIQNTKYKTQNTKYQIPDTSRRPSFWQLLGLFALVLLLGKLLSSLGLFKTSYNFGSGMSFGAIFVVGLVAASSSCIAVTGGLLLSAAARFNERFKSSGRWGKMRPVFLFVAGRVASYTLLGGLLAVIGKALTPSPLITAFITLLAALFMLIMGLDMLGLAPGWLKRFLPQPPKSLSHKILEAENKQHPVMPFLLGAGTFFLPCGFTQSLQLYALTTGSFGSGALTMLAFALGTAPALLGLGWASSSLKGKLGAFFFRFSGALVVILGLWNIQNGLTLAGYPIPRHIFTKPIDAQAAADPNIRLEGDTQVVKMRVDGASGGYYPSHFTLRAGQKVRWEIDGTNADGCLSALVSRQLGVQRLLKPGLNLVEFTPQERGEIKFSCSMGMFRGSFTVI